MSLSIPEQIPNFNIGKDSNLEDITLNTPKRSNTVTLRNHPKPIPHHNINPNNNNAYIPSPLKSQLSRSRSVQSNTSTGSSSSLSNPDNSQYIVHVNKTPNNLTPSQRLKLRKDQLNDSIAKFKHPAPIRKSELQYCKEDNDDDEIDEEEIDEDMSFAFFNVPISQPLTSLANKEKFTFANNDRKFSFTTATDSTRTSSILSHDSFVDTESSCDHEIMTMNNKDKVYQNTNSLHSTSSFLSQQDINELRLSQDALELTLLFNQTESIQINEESRQKRKLLSSFKRLNQSVPPSPHAESFLSLVSNSNQLPQQPPPPLPVASFSNQKSLKSTRSVNDLKSPNNKPMRLSLKSSSNPSLPLTTKSPPKSQPQSPSQYTSFTRPTWLPPKSSKDKMKHQRESETLLNHAIVSENKRQMQISSNLNKLNKLKQIDLFKWENEILPNGSTIKTKDYRNQIKTKAVKEMYWRGLPPSLRSRIWWQQIGNSINLTPSIAKNYWEKYNMFKSQVNSFNQLLIDHNLEDSDLSTISSLPSEINNYINSNPSIIEFTQLHQKVVNDLFDTFPDVNFFQNSDVMELLEQTIVSFVIYMSETINKVNFTKTNKIITNYYFTGLNNLAALLYYNYSDVYMSFTSLCNMFTHNQLMNILITHQMESIELNKTILCDLFGDLFMNKFEAVFQKRLNRLSCHFKIIGLSSVEYLPNLLVSLFANLFNFELSSHIFDVWVFESDEFLIKVLLGLLSKISHKLFGTKQEIIDLLGEQNRKIHNKDKDVYKYINVGYDYEFMDLVRNC